jgi:hypothetical protein
MPTPQAGVFTLGTASHAHLEFDLWPSVDAASLVARVAGFREPRTTIGGVNPVAGFRRSCGQPSHVFDLSRDVVSELAPSAKLVHELVGPYHHDRRNIAYGSVTSTGRSLSASPAARRRWSRCSKP